MWDHFVLKKVRNAFGGQVRLLVAGGAPIRAEVLAFFKCSIGCPVSYISIFMHLQNLRHF